MFLVRIASIPSIITPDKRELLTFLPNYFEKVPLVKHVSNMHVHFVNKLLLSHL